MLLFKTFLEIMSLVSLVVLGTGAVWTIYETFIMILGKGYPHIALLFAGVCMTFCTVTLIRCLED